MSSLTIDLEQRSLKPTQTVEGRVEWRQDQPFESLEIILFWYTEGKGDQDVGVVASETHPVALASGEIDFRFALPEGPYSASGRLISIRWAVEVIGHPGTLTAREELVVSPTGQEVMLEPLTTPSE